MGLSNNHLLHKLSAEEQELILRGFLSALRSFKWSVSGSITQPRTTPVAGKTIRSAASELASTFRHHLERSPLHITDGTILRPTLRALLKAFDNVDPPTKRQKAITPRFLRALYANGRRRRPNRLALQHTADLIIAVFFFACRSCEYTVTPNPGITRRLCVHSITFRDVNGIVLHHHDPALKSTAEMVTVCFEYTKNRSKLDRRTQRRTKDRILCPVVRFASLIQRIHAHVPNSGPNTPICATLDENLRPIYIDNAFTLSFLRSTCLDYGGTTTFGFAPLDIGNKSLRSGAAMALFMARHSPDRIMLMGRWKSTSFLDYLRPQVLEWTHHMATDMIRLDRFFDLDTSKSTLHPHRDTDNGRTMEPRNNAVEIQRFNMDFDRILK